MVLAECILRHLRLIFGSGQSPTGRAVARVSITDPGFKLSVSGWRLGFKSFTGMSYYLIELQETTVEKNLGIWVDNELGFKEHILSKY